MRQVMGRRGSLFVAATLTAVLVWQVVGHVSTLEAAGQSGHPKSGGQNGAFGTASSMSTPVLVGPLLLPNVAGCAPQNTSIDVPSPDGRPVGRLSPIPSALAEHVTATFPPCSVPKAVPASVGQAPASTQISFQALSQIQYVGREGTVTVLTAVPSSVAISQGLNLGNPAGSLPDGTQLFSMQFADDGSGFPINHLRWFRDGRIIALASNLPLDTLEKLAVDVAVT